MDWDPSREYDSQTFSEDYNLHGASGRSFDHPSVTRDDHFLRGVLNNLNNEGQQKEGAQEHDDEHEDRSSIDDADIGLIVDIVDGKNPAQLQQQQQRRGRASVQQQYHETDDNSRASIMRYLIDGTQDQEEIQQQLHDHEPLHFDPNRQQQQYYPQDEANYTEYSGSTPRRQVRSSILDQRVTPRASPMTPRRTMPFRQQQQQQQYQQQPQYSDQPSRLQPPRLRRSVSIEESPRQRPTGVSQRPSGIPQRSGLARPTGIPSVTTESPMRRTSATTTTTTTTNTMATEDPNGQTITNFADLPKPMFRSAMKAPKNYGYGTYSNTHNDAQQQSSRSKLGRHIQLPEEKLHTVEDESEDDEEEDQEQERAYAGEGVEEEGEEEMGDEEETHESWEPVVHPHEPTQEVEEDIVTERSPPAEVEAEEHNEASVNVAEETEPKAPLPASPVQTVIPGSSRFTRVTNKNNSPVKKSQAIIPNPQDEQEEEKVQNVHQTIKDLKAMLGRLGFMPLTTTLEGSLDGLTDDVVEQGGLCEMMEFVQKLGGMYEKQKEVIHQMTDQIIANQFATGDNNNDDDEINNHDKEESDRRIAELNRQLETTQAKLSESNRESRILRDKEQEMTVEIEELTSNLNRVTLELESLALAQNSAEAIAVGTPAKQEKGKEESVQQQAQLQSVDPGWKDHIAKIEQELQALKTRLSLVPASTNAETTSPTKAQELEDLEERRTEVVLENRRLKLSNKKLTQQLLDAATDDHAVDERLEKVITEYKTLTQEIMARIGVDRQSEILPALEEIELIVQDLPQLRRFIAKTEKVIWEPEIMEGLVRVQKVRSFRSNSVKDKKRDVLESEIPPGKTCSQPLEVTLQRLQEWSELLDVLNHVEFADELDDNATVVPSGGTGDSY
ncbi:hypothetical protein BGZ83_004345 [Gryganskiella cystojenkinii]|nr:hypothetical protein BGZ83_004345 [Gryganskiella cystojenkinii]